MIIRYQCDIGKKISEIISAMIDLALLIEIKAILVHEESLTHYDAWIKEDKHEKRIFGLTLSYDIG